MWFPKIMTEDDMNQIKEKVHALEQRQDACDVQHLSHNRRYDDLTKQSTAQTKLLEGIHETIKSYKPTIDRSARTYTTIDTILRWAGGVAVLLGVYHGLQGVIL